MQAGNPGAAPARPLVSDAALRGLASLGAFAIIFSSMVFVIDVYGLSIPFHDEWDAEAYAVYAPLLQGNYGFWNLFDPHNGHYIIFTRLSAIALFAWNSGWDPELQMILGAFLHALTGMFVVCIILRKHSELLDWFAVFAAVVLFSIPFSWMSILVAFQTQFYFMLLFAVLALQALCESRRATGYFLSICSYLSMSGGAFVLPAFALVAGFRMCREKAVGAKQAFDILVPMMIFLMMILCRSDANADELYSARNVLDFALSTGAALSWPFRPSHFVGILVFAPLCYVLARSFTGKRAPDIYLAIGVFVLCQILAMALFRGASGISPANRYVVILSLGLCVNILCAVEILKAIPRPRSARKGTFLIVGWLVIAIHGALFAGYQSFAAGLPERHEQNQLARSLILEYLASDDPAVFEGYEALEISYDNPERLAALLSDPAIRSVLPSELTASNQDRLAGAKNLLYRSKAVLLLLGFTVFLAGCHGKMRKRRLRSRQL